MPDTGVAGRIPSNSNLLSPTGFTFQVLRLKNTNFFVTGANLPGLTSGPAVTGTFLNDLKMPGDNVEYEDLSITFQVDEDLKCWQEIHDWIRGSGWAVKQAEYPNESTDRISDCDLTILTAAHNPNIRVTFRDAFPVGLSAIELASNTGDIEYPSATATFAYNYYSIELVNPT